ncbi:hypothetical protein [Nostoc sp. CHAB 5836]|uniref:DUF6887 family protein n=1 Tax=Nostoc sp. CHAB 5836 TaxID=2780404 RepID=UPI001E4BBB6E|nr:hypothetical protein [Nostoc sp. CHAB 5836]
MSTINKNVHAYIDLREYILAHRDDEDAIHAMAIRLRNQGKTGTVEEFLEHVKQQTLGD